MRGSPLCNQLFQLIESVQCEIDAQGKDGVIWSDESQEQFLSRNNAESWFSAPDTLIQRGINSVTMSAKMFGFSAGLQGLDSSNPHESNIRVDIYLPPNDHE